MPARRLLPLLALGLAAACGRGADSTGAPTTTSTFASGPGVHDHTPHHGGVVGMAGDLHLEALAAPDGRVRVYLTDFWRRPLPAASATGTVTLELTDGDRALPLALAGDALDEQVPGSAENRLEHGSGFHRRAPPRARARLHRTCLDAF